MVPTVRAPAVHATRDALCALESSRREAILIEKNDELVEHITSVPDPTESLLPEVMSCHKPGNPHPNDLQLPASPATAGFSISRNAPSCRFTAGATRGEFRLADIL